MNPLLIQAVDLDSMPFVLLALVVLLTVVALWRSSRSRFRTDMPFTRRPSLLTQAELRFCQVLLRAAPEGMAVFVKVRLMDIVSVPDHAWRQYGAPGSGMHVDFVLADAGMAPRLVIELDDRSHWQAEARQRDGFKDAALASARMPILRVTAAARYDEGDLRARIGAALVG